MNGVKKIAVTVKANARQEAVEKISEENFVLRVKAPAKENKANQAVIKVLSEFFDLPKSRITIKQGLTCRNKVVWIDYGS